MKPFATPLLALADRCLRRGLLALSLALGLLLAGAPLRAQTVESKVATDLRQVMAAATTPKLNWVKDVNGQRYVKALIVSNADDPDLTSLRAAVMGSGGSVYMRFVSVRALSVLVPARQVLALAARSDVQSISPNHS